MRRWWATDPSTSRKDPDSPLARPGVLCAAGSHGHRSHAATEATRPLKPRGHQSHACFPQRDATRGSLAKASVVLPGGQARKGE